MLRTLVTIVYLLVGVAVANANGYLGNLDDVTGLVSAALAVLLWPLVLLGIDLNIGDEVRGRRR